MDFVDLAERATLAHWQKLVSPSTRLDVERICYPLIARMLEVRRVEQLTPRMVRVTLGGNMTGFATGAPTDHVTLFFPAQGADRPEMPLVTEGRWVARGADASLLRHRDYTVRYYEPDAGELDIDFVLHGSDGEHGVAARWAAQARPGQWLGTLGPRGSVVVSHRFDWYLFAVDETAVPALARWLEELPADARVMSFIEVADAAEEQQLRTAATLDITWLHRDHRRPDQLERAVRAAVLPPGAGYVWVAGEAGAIRPLRAWLRDELEFPPDRYDVDGYWRRGVAYHDHQFKED